MQTLTIALAAILASLTFAVAAGLALAVVAGLTLTPVLTRLAVRRAPALGRFVTVDGVRLHLRNEGEGPTVLLIHGAKGSLYDHELELAPLLRDRYRVITVDRPGSGYSARVPEGGERRLDGTVSRRSEPALDGGSSRESGSPFVQADLLHGAAARARARRRRSCSGTRPAPPSPSPWRCATRTTSPAS